MRTPTPRVFDIEGHKVLCYLCEGHRLWRCECAYFQRTLTQYGEGFCPHMALAIMRAIEDGSLTF